MAQQDTQKDQAQQKDFPPNREEQVRGIADTEVDDADEDFDEDDELDEEEEDSEGAI